jgi:SAM-dependent methyltransferase
MKSARPDLNPANAWEEAYQRFETPAQEIRKFTRRLRRLGCGGWSREAQVVELFCGRGNGLHALQRLGFRQVEGVDLSPTLAAQYQGAGRVHVGDCRQLPLDDASRDIAIVQGGLHHLPSLEDLSHTLAEASRILRPGGRFVAVEPWLTPFLRLTHALCEVTLVRRCAAKVDALAVMIEHERSTYERWLGQPQAILDSLRTRFETERCRIAWGKLVFVGLKPPRPS